MQASEEGPILSEVDEKHTSGAKEAAKKLGGSGENGGKYHSGTEAHVDSIGFMRGLKPPPPSASSFSADCKAEACRAPRFTDLFGAQGK